jgi:hypothetical protein
MTMRVASPVGRRIGNVGGEMQHSGSFELLSVVERIVDDIVGQIVIFPKWRERPCSSRRLVRSVGTFRSLPSDKLVSQNEPTRNTPGLPTVETQGAHPQRSRQDHTTSFHLTRRKRSGTLAREGASGSPVRCVGLARQFILIWFDHTQPSPLLPMASTGHPSMASWQSASSSGVVGCLNT